ncbi:phage baseplate assembly protein V [Streptomyces sp. NPDC058252]|uniref:phage baseplate assembly protein V n=1 Tax=Streptomyces sp. NPDC058252 TaxID=3346405 RepID=UPI0036E48AE8
MSSDRVLGLFRATVANNADPLSQTRVTLFIPQVLGNAESAWAVPSSPTNRVPDIGQVLWVQFSGGDITKPVYEPLGLLEITADQMKAGTITAESGVIGSLDVELLNGKTFNGVDITGSSTVTGATVQTSTSGRRTVLAPDGNLYFYSGDADEVAPAFAFAEAGAFPMLRLGAPDTTGHPGGEIQIWTLPDGTQVYNIGHLQVSYNVAFGDEINLSGGKLTIGPIDSGKITRSDEIFGKVTITPIANTPTSVTISGLFVEGATYYAWATANSSVPGTEVKEVTVSDVTQESLTVWINRSDTTPTTVYWMLKGL